MLTGFAEWSLCVMSGSWGSNFETVYRCNTDIMPRKALFHIKNIYSPFGAPGGAVG
jgi:hypothetical protein